MFSMHLNNLFENIRFKPENNGRYSIAETDALEDINSICYLQEVDIDTLEGTGEIRDFVAIVSDKYHEIASEFP